MRRGIARTTAALASMVVIALAGSSGAYAQQPPSGGPPKGPLPPASADLQVSLHGEGNTEQAKKYEFEVRVVNHGPGTATGVAVVVDTPGEFDLDDTDHEAECVTNPEADGRMICYLGDLPPGADVRLTFQGEYREDGDANTHVSVWSTTPDPDPGNDSETQPVRVYDPDHGQNGGSPPPVESVAPPPRAEPETCPEGTVGVPPFCVELGE